ncbi:MAG: hypothetical protein LDL23_09655 [Flavobacterium sp.]|uniref:hypothetical protein n=1 Tax=Flavobacterium sp. TaxID=239 RepID=UPI0025C31FF2|nr:hypothetical protein [Flavobacterium sp.]MCA1966900.1 hypothetical protein [Flavobacterium sp.]
MSFHTLTKLECKEIINVEILKSKKYDEDFNHLSEYIEGIKYWDIKLSSINNILTILLEQVEKKDINSKCVIDYLYNLSENTSFYIQETDLDFLDLLYKNTLHADLTLEDYLINTQNELLSRL